MVAPSVTGLLHPGELGRGEPFRGQTGWGLRHGGVDADDLLREPAAEDGRHHCAPVAAVREEPVVAEPSHELRPGDRKSTRLNSSHVAISYAVFCWKKKQRTYRPHSTP